MANYLVMDDPRWHAKRSRLAAWLRGEGIEIGALHRPLEVPSGAHVQYVDRLPEEELRRHYPELGDYSFAPVTLIGDAEHLEAVASDSLDFVIANHLLEHLEYPVRGLVEMFRVLRPGGVLYAAIPDFRMGLDRPRDLTTVEHLIMEHRTGGADKRIEHFKEWVIHAEKRTERIEERAHELSEMDYSIHFHVWRADTFLDFLIVARREFDLDFEVLAFAPPEYPGDDEVVVILGNGHHDPPLYVPTPRPVEDVERAYEAPPSPVTLRHRVAQSPVGPVLRPLVRAARRIRRR